MKQKYSVLAVAGIVLVLYSLVVLVAPLPKTAVFWVSYVFTLIALVSQLLFMQVAFGGGTSLRSRFYGFPIFRVGIVYLTVQVVLSLVFMILGGWIPLWIPVLCYCVVLGMAAIGLIAADNVRDSVRVVEEKQADGTVFIRNLRRGANVLSSRYPELEPLAEALRYADPVSTGASEPYERQLAELMNQMESAPDEAARIRLKNQAMELLNQRNAVCKSSKTR